MGLIWQPKQCVQVRRPYWAFFKNCGLLKFSGVACFLKGRALTQRYIFAISSCYLFVLVSSNALNWVAKRSVGMRLHLVRHGNFQLLG